MPLPVSILDALDAESHPATLLDAQGLVLYVNAAWAALAAQGHPPPGTSVRGAVWLDHVPEPERPILADVLGRVRALRRGTGSGVTRVAECNCGGLGRLVSTRFMPVFDPDGDDVLGIAVLHTVIEEFAVGTRYAVVEPDPARHTDAHGHIRMCCSCRRVHAPSEDRWEYVTSYADRPPANLSHGICPMCFEAYYAEHPASAGDAQGGPGSTSGDEPSARSAA